MNGMAATCLSDFVLPAYKYRKGKDMNAETTARVAKFLAGTIGILATFMSFLPNFLGESIFGLTSLTFGITTGPTAGLFFTGMMMPKIKNTVILINC